MEQVPVSIRFVRGRKNRRTGIHSFFVEFIIPIEGRPMMLPPEENECSVYAIAMEHEQLGKVKLEFTLTPRDELASRADVLVGLHEVFIWIQDVGNMMTEEWKKKRSVRIAGVLDNEESKFTITFSRSREK